MNVWIWRLGWPEEPVFHAWGRSDHTACNRRLDSATQVHLNHAVKFARPCRKCWPGGRDN